MNKAKYFIVACIVSAIAIVGVVIYSKKSAYEVPVQLSQAERTAYEERITLLDKEINAIKPPERPDIDFFIEKARAEEYLGRYGQAVDTLLNAFKYYQNTSAGWNNIAKLYDKMGEYKSAIVFYTKLIDAFSLNRYYLDIAWDNYRLGNLDTAREAYGRFTQFANGKDRELFELLYKGKSP